MSPPVRTRARLPPTRALAPAGVIEEDGPCVERQRGEERLAWGKMRGKGGTEKKRVIWLFLSFCLSGQAELSNSSSK